MFYQGSTYSFTCTGSGDGYVREDICDAAQTAAVVTYNVGCNVECPAEYPGQQPCAEWIADDLTSCIRIWFL